MKWPKDHCQPEEMRNVMENHLAKDSVHFVIIINQVGDEFQYIRIFLKLKKRFLCMKNIAKDQMLLNSLRYSQYIMKYIKMVILYFAIHVVCFSEKDE